MSYYVNDESADEEIAPLRPVQRRSTLPARIAIPPPSAMRRPSRSHISPSREIAFDRQPGARRRNNVVVPDEALPQTQNPAVIINNYTNAESGDSEDHRSRRIIRSARRDLAYISDGGDEDDVDFRVRSRRRLDHAPNPYYRVSSSTSEDDDSDNLYNFTPSYASVSSESLKDRASSVDSYTPFLPTIGASPSRNAKIMHVYKAQYTGDGCQEGNHASRLNLLHDPRHPQQALFRWIHVEQPVLNFDAFWDEIAGITNLTSSEKSGIKKLLQDIKSGGIKRVVTTHGTHKLMQTKGFAMRRLQTDDTEISRSRDRAVYWFNLPFFELKKYSSEKYSSELFPAQTLMQADYSQHLMARDMQQAVRQIKEGPEEHCFHISQLWGIVINNSLLVTCSTMSDKLGNDRIEIRTVPPKENSSESEEPRIQVEYRENTLWDIPLRECLTWFAFITHFWEFWPDNVQFYRHRKLLSSYDWPDIVESAQHGTNRVILMAMMKPLPSPPVRGVLTPIVETKISNPQPYADDAHTKSTDEGTVEPVTATPSASDEDELSRESKSFSVFSWIQPSPEFSRTMAAKSELGHIDQFMRRRTRRSDQRAYNECPEATPGEIRAELERLAVEKNLLELDERSELRLALQDRIDVFNSAIVIFTYFLPLHFVGPSTGKLWGSLKLLLDRNDFTLTEIHLYRHQRPWPEESNEGSSLDWTRRQRGANSTLYSARKALRGTTRQIILFRQVMSHAPDPNNASIEIPAPLLQAYIYFVLALVQASIDTNRHQSHMRTFSSLLQAGMRTMLKSFSPASLLTYSSLLPTDILSLISLRLLGDITGPYLDINSVYSECIKTLENEIETKPALSHQEKIQWLVAEINVIIETLEKQASIFNEMMRSKISSSRTVLPAQSSAPGVSRAPGESSFLQRSLAPERTRTRTRTRTRSRERYHASEAAPAPFVVHTRSHAYAQPYEDDGSVYSADRYGRDDPDEGFQLSALDPGGYRMLLARDCLSIVEQRLAEFRQFRRKAQALQQANTHKTETRKDYHDQAVYAFTIVTVIFLPLSAISSIFGMNTSDIRDLEQGQWLYWATAVPVTLGVILIGLWWMGELGNAALWLLNLRQRQSAPTTTHKEHGGYVQPVRMSRYSDSDDPDELDVRIRRAPPPQVIRNTRYL
ncbi:hypothetical protein F4803DRAFT_556393 [Xylaria telfairii]|nr:hypothetical protein F4803DRAFT_556393 [Xylaria telfairii]